MPPFLWFTHLLIFILYEVITRICVSQIYYPLRSIFLASFCCSFPDPLQTPFKQTYKFWVKSSFQHVQFNIASDRGTLFSNVCRSSVTTRHSPLYIPGRRPVRLNTYCSLYIPARPLSSTIPHLWGAASRASFKTFCQNLFPRWDN